jgi:hypothetical protein
MDYADLLAALLPPQARSSLKVQEDGIASAMLDGLLVASWANVDEYVTVAAYSTTGGQCRHLWSGPCTIVGAIDAASLFRSEGLSVAMPSKPTASDPRLVDGLADILDLFG